ncbi:MAG TPA: hypothetical protein VGM39_08180 [Kofleriaceae bacterium]
MTAPQNAVGGKGSWRGHDDKGMVTGLPILASRALTWARCI